MIDDDVRAALGTLLTPEPPMPFSAMDDERRGRALRTRRRQRWSASGVVAALLVGAVAFVGIPRISTNSNPIAGSPAPTASKGPVGSSHPAIITAEREGRVRRLLATWGFEPSPGRPDSSAVGFTDGRSTWIWSLRAGSEYLNLTAYPKRSTEGAAVAACKKPGVDCGPSSGQVADGISPAHTYEQSIRDLPIAATAFAGARVLERVYGNDTVLELVNGHTNAGTASEGTGRLLTDQQLTALADAYGSPTPLPDPVVPTSSWTPGQAGMQALIVGRLMRMGDGCLALASESSSTYTTLVWPKGYTARWRVDGVFGLEVVAPGGEVVAREGGFPPAIVGYGGGGADVATLPAQPCLPKTGKVFVIQQDLTRR